ncbi:glycosyl transferase group 1 [Thermotoga sp. Mc24]|uniref:glycosyltransferase n=1 Tax=Thermotoga sp. Mc24 TaxID=1231241 RepID=UPI000541E847|nr:glycosyltransferase [Thermotoga sp. Mc24]KHC90377.1 glycosyl transferase group 1 [Thermotoga sp. Mc24]
MKLVYVAYVFFDRNLGVRKKLIAQMKVFSRYFDSYLLTLEGNDVVLYNGKEWKVEKRIPLSEEFLFTDSDNFMVKAIRVLRRTKWFFKTTGEELKDFDVVYTRAFLPVKESIKFLEEIRRKNTKIILEYPTYPFRYEFFRTYGPLFFLVYYPRYRRINDLVDLVVVFGEKELSGRKLITISNGIDPSDVTLRKPVPDENVLNLIGVARLRYWHGYDRVVRGLWEYYRRTPERKVYFHIVGDGPELPRLKKLTKKLELEEYVVFHGPKHGGELDRLFDSSHVAVASLGMHRSNLKTGSTLKVREYCARGIPFVVGYKDVDFPEDFPFLLRIPSDESPVDIQKVISFYEELKKTHPDYPLLMRKYAEEHLSWEIKMKPLVERIMEMR